MAAVTEAVLREESSGLSIALIDHEPAETSAFLKLSSGSVVLLGEVIQIRRPELSAPFHDRLAEDVDIAKCPEVRAAPGDTAHYLDVFVVDTILSGFSPPVAYHGVRLVEGYVEAASRETEGFLDVLFEEFVKWAPYIFSAMKPSRI